MDPLIPLYVPGDRPDRFDKAMHSPADAIIIDLEDAVSAAHKDQARAAAVAYLSRAHPKPVHVRINHPATPWGAADLAALRDTPPGAVRIPKLESAAEVRAVAQALASPAQRAVGLVCLLESARGVEAAYEIATAHPDVAAIGLGEADLSGDLGVSGDEALHYARGRIVVAARAAELPPPLLSVFPDLADPEGLHESTLRGRALGFLGRTLIHPRQAEPVLRAFAPRPAEVAAAERLLDALRDAEALDGGTLVLPDGRFADRAMAGAARRTLAVRDALVTLTP